MIIKDLFQEGKRDKSFNSFQTGEGI